MALDYPFCYKNEDHTPIQFYKTKCCGDIITGCLYHTVEWCKCGKCMIDQEDGYMRATGEFVNITNELTNEEKRNIFTKTLFNEDKFLRNWIKNRINHPGYVDEVFDIDYYKQLYKDWSKINNYRSCAECKYFTHKCVRNSKSFDKRYIKNTETGLSCVDLKVKCDKFDKV